MTTSLILLATQLTNPMMIDITIRLDKPAQVIENFAASDSWTVEPLIKWPVSSRKKIATLLFDQEKGIGLSAWRINFGGGINHQSITNPLRTVDSFLVSPGVYDWKRVPGQQWMAQAAKNLGVKQFIGYAVTPPKPFTRNGLTNGTDGLGSTNLKPGFETEYAKYLLDIVDYYKGTGINISHLSPVNEPDFEWNGVPKPDGQEGNRASNEDILAILKGVQAEAKARKSALKLLSPEANSPQVGYERNRGMENKYKASYGNYVDFFATNLAQLDPEQFVYGYHSYWSDSMGDMVSKRQKLRAALDKSPHMKVWQTEFCQMNGPRGEGGWGRDLGMTLALNLTRILHLDLSIVNASAWQWWLAVSDSDYKDGLVYVDDLNSPDGSIYASKSLWSLGQFSRFVRPGYRRVAVESAKVPATSNSGILTSAFVDPTGKKLVIVAINTETASGSLAVKGGGSWRGSYYRTSDRPGEDLKKIGAIKADSPLPCLSRSVTTFLFDL